MAVSQSRNHHHTGHLPLAGADNYLGIVPLRASTCDGVRVRGLCMNPFTLVGACLLNPSPWPARVPRCPAHGRRLGPIAVSSLAARLLCVCPGVVQKRPLQVQNLTVFRPRATWQLQSTMASGRCSRNLTPSIHPPLSLAFALCDSNFSCPCCCSCCSCFGCPCISSLRLLPLRSFVVRFFQNSDTPGPHSVGHLHCTTWQVMGLRGH